MRPLAFRLRIILAAALVVAGGAFTPAHAQWMDVATVSSTLGNTPYRLCMGGGRTDIGCPADAPLLDRSLNRLTVPTDLRVMGNLLVSGSQSFDGVTFANGGVSATGTISATGFSGDGSGLTGIDFSSNPVDRIVSGTAAVIAQQGGTVGLTLGGVADVAYFHPTLGFVGPGVSVTGPISGTHGYFGGHVGIGTTAPSDVLDIQKPETFSLQFPIRLTQQSSDETGAAATGIAFKVAATSGDSYFKSGIAFARTAQYGRGSLYLLNSDATDGSNAGLESVRMAILPDGRIGVGTRAPSTSLHVNGALRIAYGSEQCDADRTGAMKFQNGRFYICQNGSVWEQMATTTSNTLVSINTGLSGSIVFRDEYGYLKANNTFNISSTTGSVGIGAGPPAWLGDHGLFSLGAVFADLGFIMDNSRRVAWGDNTTHLQGSTLPDDEHLLIAVRGSEAMRIVSTGHVGIGTDAPSTSLHVNGTLRIANGAEACDANRIGAIRFDGGQFRVCRNGSTWEYMVAGGSGSVDADRITSGTTAVMAHRDASVTISTGGLERVTVGTGGNVGIGVATPDRPLTVLGTVSVTMLNLGSDGTPCTAAERGTIKYEGNKIFMCRD